MLRGWGQQLQIWLRSTGPSRLPLPPLSLLDASQQGLHSQVQWLSEAGEHGTCVGAGALALGPMQAQHLFMPTF